MAKFLKSLFSPSAPEKRKDVREHNEIEGDSENPIGDRRKLSMSRSGRLRHANKKRHSLTLDLYGTGDELKQVEKPKSLEYHVHGPMDIKPDGRKTSMESTAVSTTRNGSKSPEEEIDSAFEIIDTS